jgi:hypothetical protein
MGASVTLTTLADLPGQNIDTGAVTKQAGTFRTVGSNLEHGTGDVLRAWQALPSSYASTGADAVYSAMIPVGTQGATVATALRTAAKALDQYVEDVQPILTKIGSLKQEILDFQSTTIPSYPKKGLGDGSAGGYVVADGATVQYDSWEDDPHAVETNHEHLVRAHSLTADLLEAQQRCATAIRAAAGLPAAGASDVAAAEKSLRATDLHWSARVAVENSAEGCAGSTNRALNGIFYDGVLINGVVGTVQGLGGLIGWDGDHDWSWDQAGESWVGLAHLATGLAMIGPLGAVTIASVEGNKNAPGWMRDWERDSVGSVLGLTGLVGVSLPTKWWDADAWSKNDYFTAWEHDGWQTLGSSVFNVATIATGAGSASKVGDVVRLAKGERAATIGELLESGGINALRGNDAARLMKLMPGLDAADAARLESLLQVPKLDTEAVRGLGLGEQRVWTSYEIAHDPVHSAEPRGKHWERQPDPTPVDPDYGHPKAEHGTTGPLPAVDAGAAAADPSLDALRVDHEAPYGRDLETGVPLGHPTYDQRYTLPSTAEYPNGVRWPTGAEANPGTIVQFDSVRAFRRVYGDLLDRIGDNGGAWFSVEPKQGSFTFEARSIPLKNLTQELHHFRFTGRLPEGYRIEISEVREALGRPGGALQVRVLNPDGAAVQAKDLVGPTDPLTGKSLPKILESR